MLICNIFYLYYRCKIKAIQILHTTKKYKRQIVLSLAPALAGATKNYGHYFSQQNWVTDGYVMKC